MITYIFVGMVVLLAILAFEIVETRKTSHQIITYLDSELVRYMRAYEYVNSERQELRHYTHAITQTIREIDSQYGR